MTQFCLGIHQVSIDDVCSIITEELKTVLDQRKFFELTRDIGFMGSWTSTDMISPAVNVPYEQILAVLKKSVKTAFEEGKGFNLKVHTELHRNFVEYAFTNRGSFLQMSKTKTTPHEEGGLITACGKV